jgi:hypothetical protein
VEDSEDASPLLATSPSLHIFDDIDEDSTFTIFADDAAVAVAATGHSTAVIEPATASVPAGTAAAPAPAPVTAVTAAVTRPALSAGLLEELSRFERQVLGLLAQASRSSSNKKSSSSKKGNAYEDDDAINGLTEEMLHDLLAYTTANPKSVATLNVADCIV